MGRTNQLWGSSADLWGAQWGPQIPTHRDPKPRPIEISDPDP